MYDHTGSKKARQSEDDDDFVSYDGCKNVQNYQEYQGKTETRKKLVYLMISATNVAWIF